MSDILVSLDRIIPNPWQSRQVHAGDDSHVAALAADIDARGLLQPPLGRLVDAGGRPRDGPLSDGPLPDGTNLIVSLIEKQQLLVQLAFGHHRLAAYRLAAATDPDRYGRMPLRIAILDDPAMALAAWSENAARKDLTPVEAARAIERMMAAFGWSQADVAERLQMSRPAVSNKLRLLRLPEEVLAQLEAGDMSERQALAILPVFELPAAAQERIAQERERNDWAIRKLDEVLAHPEKKASGDVREAVRDVLRSVTRPLLTAEKDTYHAGFPVDREVAGIAAPACLECENRLQETRCADGACYEQKQAVFELSELAFAVAATGLQGISNAELQAVPWGAKKHFAAINREGLQRAQAKTCPTLRLHYDGSEPREWDLRVPDYPHAAYVCVRGSDATPCNCADAAEVKRQAKEKEREERRKKEAKKLRDCAVRELARALREGDLGGWRAVLWALVGTNNYHSDSSAKIAGLSLGAVCERIAWAVLRDAVHWDYPSKGGLAADLAAWRETVGWPAVVVSPEQTDEAAQE